MVLAAFIHPAPAVIVIGWVRLRNITEPRHFILLKLGPVVGNCSIGFGLSLCEFRGPELIEPRPTPLHCLLIADVHPPFLALHRTVLRPLVYLRRQPLLMGIYLALLGPIVSDIPEVIELESLLLHKSLTSPSLTP